jgi:hypothetical protein
MPAGNWRLWTLRLAPIAAVMTILAWVPLQTVPVQSDGSATVTTTTGASVSALEAWTAAAFEAGANAAGETAVVPQLLDPSVHPHTLLAPSAASQGTSAPGGSSR